MSCLACWAHTVLIEFLYVAVTRQPVFILQLTCAGKGMLSSSESCPDLNDCAKSWSQKKSRFEKVKNGKKGGAYPKKIVFHE